MLKVGESTVHRTRQRCVESGLESALTERPRPGRKVKIEGKAEAFLVATACSDPPSGRQSWTMQLLADRLVELDLVESISDEAVRLRLKKTHQTMVKRTMVYLHSRSRIRLADGRCFGFIFSSL